VGLGFLVLGLGVRREVLEVFGKGVWEGCLLDGFWCRVWELWGRLVRVRDADEADHVV
jgi:hypothetical protein